MNPTSLSLPSSRTPRRGPDAPSCRATFAPVFAAFLFFIVGCQPEKKSIPERQPRPVKIAVLERQAAPSRAMVPGSVAAWKTENIGFEVGGRVKHVVEPNTTIEGRIIDKNGQLLLAGTPIAHLESERYELAVQRAQANVERARQSLLAAETELNENLPAQRSSADSARQLAKVEFERSMTLFRQQAAPRGDVDRTKASYESAIAQMKQLDAARNTQLAQIESLKSAQLQADQNLRDAQRNLEDCTLYASFNGDIASIDVVPGTVVNAGQPIAKLQMMDPIKVEIQASAKQSRRLRPNHTLPLSITMPDGSTETREGHIYQVDQIADPLTRTFAVTILLFNEQIASVDSDPGLPRARDIWPLNFDFITELPPDTVFVEEGALLQDALGSYLWLLTNMTTESPAPDNNLLQVRKLRVTPQALKLPFLSNWEFQSVKINEPGFDPIRSVIAGALTWDGGGSATWNGDTILMDPGPQWMLRPGDLVRVGLSAQGQRQEGIYVPMNVLVRQNGETMICLVEAPPEGHEDHAVVRRLPVVVQGLNDDLATSNRVRIQPADPTISLDGLSYVTEGAHYLYDGETVHVASP